MVITDTLTNDQLRDIESILSNNDKFDVLCNHYPQEPLRKLVIDTRIFAGYDKTTLEWIRSAVKIKFQEFIFAGEKLLMATFDEHEFPCYKMITYARWLERTWRAKVGLNEGN